MSTIMTQHPNAAAVGGFYDALKAGDIEKLMSLLSPDVTFLMPGSSPLSGVYEGRDAAFGVLRSMKAATGGTYRAELRALYPNDKQCVAIHHGTGTRDDKTLDADVALVFEVTDGVITAVTVHQADQDHWDDFFS